MSKKDKDLSGKQKAALLLISLGPEVSASVYKHLSEEEIERLTLEISGVKKVDSAVKEEIIEEFHQIALAQDYITQGGIGYAKTVLEKALENYLASVRLLNIDDTKLTIYYADEGGNGWRHDQYANRIRKDISAIHTHVQNTYQTHMDMYNKNVPPQEVKK